MIPVYSLAKQSKVMVRSPEVVLCLSSNKTALESTNFGFEATDSTLGAVGSQSKSNDGESIGAGWDCLVEERVIGRAPQGNSRPPAELPPP